MLGLLDQVPNTASEEMIRNSICRFAMHPWASTEQEKDTADSETLARSLRKLLQYTSRSKVRHVKRSLSASIRIRMEIDPSRGVLVTLGIDIEVAAL